MLFSGAQPSAVSFPEQMAFRHYLHCLYRQVSLAERENYDETVSYHESVLNMAQGTLSTLTAAGIRGQQRDFNDVIDVNRAALAVLQSTRGPMLRRRWSDL